eukprot:2043929-Pyramimonas_sp.AAC.1
MDQSDAGKHEYILTTDQSLNDLQEQAVCRAGCGHRAGVWPHIRPREELPLPHHRARQPAVRRHQGADEG